MDCWFHVRSRLFLPRSGYSKPPNPSIESHSLVVASLSGDSATLKLGLSTAVPNRRDKKRGKKYWCAAQQAREKPEHDPAEGFRIHPCQGELCWWLGIKVEEDQVTAYHAAENREDGRRQARQQKEAVPVETV